MKLLIIASLNKQQKHIVKATWEALDRRILRWVPRRSDRRGVHAPTLTDAGLIDGPLQMTDEPLTVCGRRGGERNGAGSQLITPLRPQVHLNYMQKFHVFVPDSSRDIFREYVERLACI
jgi:hypothetical protein